MIAARTDTTSGWRTYTLPRAVADVAKELFPGDDQTGAVFRLARCLSLHDCHTLENIAINGSHAEALAFARERMIAPGQRPLRC